MRYLPRTIAITGVLGLLLTAAACSQETTTPTQPGNSAISLERTMNPDAIRPFRIEVAQSDLDDLAARLTRTRWPDEVPGAGDDYGMPKRRVKDLVEYWRTTYDWRKHEAIFNSLPQYVTDIDNQNIYFIHVRSANPAALPLILTHGWPGSVAEFMDVIEPLSKDFHLVIPSIPGFGFSGPTRERGWDTHRVARAWAELMRRLGYQRYGAQGGDWGSAVSRILGAIDTEHVVGVHLNYLPTPPPPGEQAGLSDTDRARVTQTERYLANQPGQRVMNSTAPQTVSYALTDSPVGLLAWLVDRIDAWVDPASALSADQILTDVMLYWLTRTAASSSRLHFESDNGPLPCPVPIGVAVFARDITRPVRQFAERTYQVTHWTEFDRGGHFAAMEVPDLFSRDVRAFFQTLR